MTNEITEKQFTQIIEPKLLSFSAGPPPEQQEDRGIPISHYGWILRRYRWKILGFVAVAVIATILISARITPVYEATATIDVDRQVPPGVIGQEANRALINDADQFLATQIKLIQSDSVLRPVARKQSLAMRENRTPLPANAARVEAAPMLLPNLRVTRPPNTYLLLISYRSPDPALASEVANGVAESYLEHTYNIRIRSSASLSNFMEKQLEELKAKMETSSMALNHFERELNIINPEEKTNILSARLLQLNQEYTNAEADRVRKETSWNSAKSGSLESAQVSTQGEALKRLMERLNDAEQKFVETAAHYGSGHPEYRKAAAQIAEVEKQLKASRENIARRVQIEFNDASHREAMLKKAVGDTKAEYDRLNVNSFEYQSLKREAEADKKLYEELIRKIKEAGINAGFQNSGIRIADLARPALNPVFPNVRLNAMMAFLVSLLLAMGLAIITDLLDNTIRDPEQVARTLSTTVIGTLPVVKSWQHRIGSIHGPAGTALLHSGDSKNMAISSYGEAIRTLRNSILLANIDRRIRSLLVTSASPGEGKSTTAANLSVAHAEQGKKTLLIDGDLRRPSVHRRFGLSGATGLSNVLLGELPWRSALIPLEGLPDLHILPAGPPSRRASDLVGRGLTELLEEAAAEYDLVILDAPPLLGFAEPLQMATAVDGVLVVTRAGETNRKAVASVLRTLERLRAPVVGVALNEVDKEMSNNYYYYGQYGKYQKYYQTKEA